VPRPHAAPSATPPPAIPGAIQAIGVALDVIDPNRGDRRLPLPVPAAWSRGAEYVLLIEPNADGRGRVASGAEGRAELFIDAGVNYSAYSRVETDKGVVPLRAPYHPRANADGLYAPLLIETNRDRVSRNGKFYPARDLDWGRLTWGREPAPALVWPGVDSSATYDPHAEWTLDDTGTILEVAIPWGLIGVSDPSTRCVLDDRDGTPEVECSSTQGIGILAWATTAKGFLADSLGPTAPSKPKPATSDAVFFLGPEGTTQLNAGHEVMVFTPASSSYLWNGWEMPITKERVKRSAIAVKQSFEGMEAREERQRSELDPNRR
jgi:hypothetical protein